MKKRMILALVLVFALLCLACSNDADDGASSSESDQNDQSVSVAETSTNASAESTSSADETSDETSTVESASSDTSSGTSTESEASGTTTSADSTSSETSTGTESSATSSDTSASSKPAENSESSKPAEGSENSKPAESSDTSSSSGNTNPSQTAHTHKYKTTVVKPTCTEDGYTLHTCSCGDSYKDNEVPATGHELDTWTLRTVKAPTYTEPGIHERQCLNCGEWVVDESMDSDWTPPVTDEKLVYQRLMAAKEIYPEGSFSDSCNDFADKLTDIAFGTYWRSYGRRIFDFGLNDIRPGDVLYMNNGTGTRPNHYVVVLEVLDTHIVIAEGNWNDTVHWGRKIPNNEVLNVNGVQSILITRYEPDLSQGGGAG